MATVEIGIDNDTGLDDEAIPLQTRIIEAIESFSPEDRTIRPGKLAQQLGISIEEASAQLSYLLAAVGGGQEGATFHFEDVSVGDNATKTMVFKFPHDFKDRLLSKQRKEDLKMTFLETISVVVKILKIITAFGLILSLLILSVAAVLGIIGALVAMSRVEGAHRQRSLLMHQLRSIFYSLRQILWLYALFGPSGESAGDGSDPFFREVAYDLFLFFSLCCGNPGSIFFWLRAGQWQTRRRRRQFTLGPRGTFLSDIPGVTLVSNSSYDGEVSVNTPSQRGLLSIIVEFLFGPTPFVPGPTSSQIGVLRAAALTKLSHEYTSVTFEQMAPFMDSPPRDLEDSQAIVQQGLLIVGYFHGIPSRGDSDTSSKTKAAFCFPELCAESTISIPSSFKERNDISFRGILYDTTINRPSNGSGGGNRYTNVRQTEYADDIPSFLWEEPFRLTRLTPNQFLYCVGLGTLNLVGVVWLWQSLPTMFPLPPTLALVTGKLVLPLLLFYAILFFVLPLGRLLAVGVLNFFRMQRNERRKNLVKLLQSGT